LLAGRLDRRLRSGNQHRQAGSDLYRAGDRAAAAPVITSASDALAVVLNERGHVDPDHIAELLHVIDVEDVIGELGEAIFRDPSNGSWQMADAYLSGRSPLEARCRAARPRTSIRPFSAMSRRWSASSRRSQALGYHRTPRRAMDPGR
jgi:hypothetical protein